MGIKNSLWKMLGIFWAVVLWTCSAQGASEDTLIVYFSRAGNQYEGDITEGNTAIVARLLAEKTGARMFELKPQQDNYQLPYKDLTELATKEKEQGLRPAYIGEVPPLDQVKTVFVGSPVWWGDFPMIMYTFFERHDLNGKKIVPFCTHEGSGLSGFDLRLRDLYKQAEVTEGLAIKGSVVQQGGAQLESLVSEFVRKVQ